MKILISVAALLVCAHSVLSAPIVFTNQSAFLSAASGLRFESFETLPATNTVGAVQVITTADFAITHSGPLGQPFDTLGVFNVPLEGQFPTDGTHWVYARTEFAPSVTQETINIRFNQPVDEFGFTITDALDVGLSGNYLLTLSTDAGDSVTVLSGQHSDGNQAFFGMITNNPFKGATLLNFRSQDGYGLDSFNYRFVPEPTTATLLLLGMLGCGWRRRSLKPR